MVQTKMNGQRRINNGKSFGGSKAWRQHRYDGDSSNVVARNTVSRRFAQQEMLADVHSSLDGVYDGGNPLGFDTPDGDERVCLRFDGAGKLMSAHCG